MPKLSSLNTKATWLARTKTWKAPQRNYCSSSPKDPQQTNLLSILQMMKYVDQCVRMTLHSRRTTNMKPCSKIWTRKNHRKRSSAKNYRLQFCSRTKVPHCRRSLLTTTLPS